MTIELQEKCGKFVDREVFFCMSNWADYYIKHEESCFQEWENYQPSDDEGRIEGDDNFDEDSSTFPEIYEWWAVSSFLYGQLKEKGEVVWDHPLGGYLWGRCCTGQAILLDLVIRDIVKELEVQYGS